MQATATTVPATQKRQFSLASFARLLIYVALSGGAMVMAFPLVWMMLSSFKTLQEARSVPITILPQVWTLDNYTAIFTKLPWVRIYGNSLFVAATVTVGVLFFCALAGYTFAKFRFPGQNVLFTAILSTMMVPFVVRMIPLYLVVNWLGWTDQLVGIIVPAMMSAFGIFMMRQYMHTVPSELIDAARVDGASEFGIFLTLVLPLTTPALSALGILTFLWSWDDFLWPLIVLSTREHFTIPLGLATFNQAEWTQAEATMMAGSTMAIIPVLLVFFTFQKQFIRGIALSGMKG